MDEIQGEEVMKQDYSENRMEVTGMVGPGEVLMVARDPDGSNILTHSIINPTGATGDNMMALIADMFNWIERYKVDVPLEVRKQRENTD